MPKTKPFDKYYKDYEEWFQRYEKVYKSELKAVARFIPEKGRGIEIGIGNGMFALPLGIKEGVEPSYEMRKLARQKGLNAWFGVAEQLPLEDETYDFALMVTTICFVDDPRKVLHEIYRILRLNGSIVIGFVDKNSPVGKIYQENKKKSKFYSEANFFSAGEVENLLDDAGFERMEFVQTIFGQLDEVEEEQDFKKGYGEGSFVVVRGVKKRAEWLNGLESEEEEEEEE